MPLAVRFEIAESVRRYMERRVKVRRILLDEHKERLKRSKCPRCNKFQLKKIEIAESQPLPATKYKLTKDYWICGGPSNFLCYFMSGISGPILFESAEDVELIDFTEEYSKPASAKIVRRRGGECVEITPADTRMYHSQSLYG